LVTLDGLVLDGGAVVLVELPQPAVTRVRHTAEITVT
jgi:hypothetical protein